MFKVYGSFFLCGNDEESGGRGNCPDKTCSVMMGGHGDTRPGEIDVQSVYLWPVTDLYLQSGEGGSEGGSSLYVL